MFELDNKDVHYIQINNKIFISVKPLIFLLEV